MKQRKVSVNFRPLALTSSIEIVGSVAGFQSYSSDFGEWLPDYSLTPLVLFPSCSVIDPNGIITQKQINASLTNMKWEQVENKVATTITENNANYEITISGAEKGQIKIKRNVTVNVPVTLRFSADYVDPRTNQVVKFQNSFLIKCTNASTVQPILSIDSGATVLYDPVFDAKGQTIKALLKVGETTVPSANRRFFWYVSENGTLKTLDADVIGFQYTTDDTVVIDRELMGNKITLVCKVSYSPTGSPAATPDGNISECVTTVIRRFPKFDYDIHNIPNSITLGLTAINPKVVVSTAKGVLQNPGRWLKATWLTQKNLAGNPWTEIAYHESPRIPTSAMDNAKGMMIAVDVVDKGPYLPATDKDGVVFTDKNGAILLIN